MKIETTIECLIHGVCLWSTDVTVNVGYKVDSDDNNELTWWVDEYVIEGTHAVWGKDGSSFERKHVCHVVPEHLALVFDRYLDREKLEAEIVERLIEDGEMRRGDTSARMAADYHSSVL